MGREVREVPEGWQHPKNEKGNYIPLHGHSFSKEFVRWKIGKDRWEKGLVWGYGEKDWIPKGKIHTGTWEDWTGPEPVESDYMPDWPESERTHLQMYETCTEGTPISPVMATPEELAHWLADNKASAFGGMTATYEQWLETIKAGWAPGMILHCASDGSGRMMSGVEASTAKENGKDAT